MKRSLLLFGTIASLAGVAACGSDSKNVTGPDAACAQTLLGVNGSITGTLEPTDCASNPDPSFVPFYDPYRVELSAGRGYVFQLLGDLDDARSFDPVLAMVRSTGNLTAYSDDQGGGTNGRNSLLAFVAPTSGVFSLHVHGYSPSDTGSYVIKAQACGPSPVLSTSVQQGAIAASDCTVRNFAFTDETDSSLVDFYQLNLAAGQRATVRAVTTAFRPTLYIGGPGFGAQCALGPCDYNYGTAAALAASVDVSFTAPTEGVYTVMVGTDPRYNGYGTVGNYEIVILP